MTIITGSGRCGTKTVATLLGCTHEANKSGFLKGWWDAKGVHEPPWDNKITYLVSHFDGMGLGNVSNIHDANNIYVHFLFELHRIFKPQIVFLTRHPLDFVTSALARNCHKGDIFGMHPSEQADPLAWAMWESWTDVERCAWIWLHRNHIAHTTLNTFQIPHWQCQVEQLYDPGVIESLEEWTGRKALRNLVPDGTRFNATKQAKPQLCLSQMMAVKNITQPLAKSLGYDFGEVP